MSEPRLVFDGHTSLFGMDADTDPTALKPVFVTKAVNRIFRGGKNDTRPSFQAMSLSFANDDDKLLFETGNVQGMWPYLKTTPGRFDGLAVSIAGTIFFIALVNESAYVSRIIDGNDKAPLHAFFVQAEEWLYVQDGHNPAIFWDGLNAATRSPGDPENKMPIGSLMNYSHGRIFLANEFNEVRASDVMFGDGFTHTTNVQNFTETDYWQEGGAFIIPSSYGQITGMVTLPAIAANLRGQGELVVFAENGAMSLDVNLPRLQWKDAQIQKTALVGRGNLAPNALLTVNGDAWYKSADGWATYSNSRLDFTNRPSFRKFSRQINNWINSENPALRRYASHVFFDNRILGTTQPTLSLTRTIEGAGSHRYFKGIVSLDLDPASGTNGGDVINFDGLWTGIRPTEMKVLRDRLFAMSYDADGINRLYEINKERGDDNRSKQIESFYVTRRMGGQASQSSEFLVKKFVGGELWVSEVDRASELSIEFRPDHCPCWTTFLSPVEFGNLHFASQRRDKHLKITSPDVDDCRPGTEELISTGTEFQLKVAAKGNVRFDRVRIYANELEPIPLKGDPCNADIQQEEPLECKVEDDFEYLIVT